MNWPLTALDFLVLFSLETWKKNLCQLVDIYKVCPVTDFFYSINYKEPRKNPDNGDVPNKHILWKDECTLESMKLLQ